MTPETRNKRVNRIIPQPAGRGAPVDAFAAYPGGGHRLGPRFEGPGKDGGGGDGGGGTTVDWASIPEEGKRVIGTIVEAQVNSAVKPITEQLGSIAEQLKARDASDSDGADKSEAAAGGDTSGEGGDAVSAKVLKQLKETNDRLDAMEKEKRSAEQTRAARKHAEAVVEKHHPKLKAKGTLIERIAQQSPESEEAAESARQKVIEEYKAVGVDTSGPQFGADPEGEGATNEPEKAPGEESEDQFTARKQREIAERGKPVGLGG